MTIHSDLPLLDLPPGRGPAAVEIIGTTDRHGRAQAWFHRWTVGRRLWLSIGRLDTGYLLRFHGMADFEISAEGRTIRYGARHSLPLETLHHLLLDQVLPLAIGRSGRLVLHASAVWIAGLGAVAFAGITGAGKSTLAAALARRGCRVVSDDAIVVDPGGAHPRVSPSYPGLRLWSDVTDALGAARDVRGPVAHYTTKGRLGAGLVAFQQRPARLRAIFVLRARRSPGATRLAAMPGPVRLIELTRYTYLLDVEDRAQLASLFARLAALVETTPVTYLDVADHGGDMGALAEDVLQRVVRVARERP